MGESMQGLRRSHRCTEVSAENIGETVTIWDGCRKGAIWEALFLLI